MSNIRYQDWNKNQDYIATEEINNLIESIKKQMHPGNSIMSAGGVNCEFYYGDSPVGLANVMTWGDDELTVRLIAPNKSSLKKLTDSLGVSYDESRVGE